MVALLVWLLCLVPALGQICEDSPVDASGCTCAYGCSGNCGGCCPLGSNTMGCAQWPGCCNNPPTPPTTMAPTTTTPTTTAPTMPPTYAPGSCEASPPDTPGCTCTYGCSGNCGCCPIGSNDMGCGSWPGCCNNPPTPPTTMTPTTTPTTMAPTTTAPTTMTPTTTVPTTTAPTTMAPTTMAPTMSPTTMAPTMPPTFAPGSCEASPVDASGCTCTYGCSGNCGQCCPLGDNIMGCAQWPGCCNNPPTPPTTMAPTTMTPTTTAPTFAPGSCEASPVDATGCTCSYGCSGNCGQCCPLGDDIMGCAQWPGCCNNPPTPPTTMAPTTMPTFAPGSCEESPADASNCTCTYGCSGDCGDCCPLGDDYMNCTQWPGCCNNPPTPPTTMAPTTMAPTTMPPTFAPGSCEASPVDTTGCTCTYGCSGNCGACCSLGSNTMGCAQWPGCCNNPPTPPTNTTTAPTPTTTMTPTVAPTSCLDGCDPNCACCKGGYGMSTCNETEAETCCHGTVGSARGFSSSLALVVLPALLLF